MAHVGPALAVLLALLLSIVCEVHGDDALGAITEAHLLVVEPRNRATYDVALLGAAAAGDEPLADVPLVVDLWVGFGTPVRVEGNLLDVPIVVNEQRHSLRVLADDGVVDDADLQAATQGFCGELGVLDDTCGHVRNSVANHIAVALSGGGGMQLQRGQVCVDLDGEELACRAAAAGNVMEGVRLPFLAPGEHIVEARVVGITGVRHSSSRFTVRPRCSAVPHLNGQPHGRRYAHGAPVEFDIAVDACRRVPFLPLMLPPHAPELGWVCAAVGEAFVGCERRRLASSTTGGASLTLNGLPVGRHDIDIWLSSTADGDGVDSLGGRINASVSVEVLPTAGTNGLPNFVVPPAWARAGFADMVVVTAINDAYVNRLANLVGSVRVWEPSLRVVVADLGLSMASRERIAEWPHVVEVMHVPFDTLPEHLRDAKGTYSFKPWVINASLARWQRVLWLDANIELRRPLDELRARIDAVGHFFTTQRDTWPNPLRHSPVTVDALQCDAPAWSRPQCWAGMQAWERGRWAHETLLPRWVECAMDRACIAPAGTNRSNHRHDQTALNAVMCSQMGADTPPPCVDDVRYWMSSAREDATDPRALQPTSDETDWNELFLYTRREDSQGPYARYAPKS